MKFDGDHAAKEDLFLDTTRSTFMKFNKILFYTNILSIPFLKRDTTNAKNYYKSNFKYFKFTDRLHLTTFYLHLLC